MNDSRVEAVFNAALAKRSGVERAAYLDGVCGEDPDLRSRVDVLLQAHDDAGNFLKPTNGDGRRGRGRDDHRPLQAAARNRRRWIRRRLHGRTAGARAAQSGAKNHQAGHGHQAGCRPLRVRTAGIGLDGSPEYRPRLRRRRHRFRATLLCDGAGPRHFDHRLLRPESALSPGAVRALHRRLPGHPTRAPKRHHSP